MKLTNVHSACQTKDARTWETARAPIFLLVLACVVLGVGAGAFWYYHRNDSVSGNPVGRGHAAGLSNSTKAVLNRLHSPIRIRLYSLMNPDTAPAPLLAFAGRVKGLLSEYQRDGGGNIKLTVIDAVTETNKEAAWADGIRPFSEDKSVVCYLGLTVTGPDRTESMSRLKPEWEPALEYDLSRMIERVSTPEPTPRPVAGAAKADRTTTEELRHTLPNLDSMSLEEGTQHLREAALQDIKTATTEMEKQIQAAQRRLIEAEANQSETERRAASQELQKLQQEQLKKVQQIARRLQEQLTALERIKGTPSP